MIVNGTVVSVDLDTTVAKRDGGSYVGCRLTYRNNEGKITDQAFHNNAFKFNQALRTSLEQLKAGDNIEITKEKKGDFWNILSISKVETGQVQAATAAAAAAKSTASPRSNFETPEERAQRQVYIVRQSSLGHAIEYRGPKASMDDIISTARAFEAYVFDTQPADPVTKLEKDPMEQGFDEDYPL